MLRAIFTEEAPKPVGPYSQAIQAGGFVFVSGQIPIDSKTGNVVREDIRAQTRCVMDNIGAILRAAGCSLSDVVMVYVFLRDIEKFQEFNEVYSEYFRDHKPARVTVGVADLPKGVDIEVSVIAYRGGNVR